MKSILVNSKGPQIANLTVTEALNFDFYNILPFWRVEIGQKENSVPLNFKSDIRKLERLGLSRKKISEESKLSIRKIEKIMKNEASVDEKDFVKLLKYMNKRAKALKEKKTA